MMQIVTTHKTQHNPLIPAKAGIQFNDYVRALPALYALDTVSWHGMSGVIYGGHIS